MDSQRVLGIDFGRKRIGIAIGDTAVKIATGYKLLAYTSHKAIIEKLAEIIAEEVIGVVVIGLPKNMNGSQSKMTEEIRGLAEKIKGEFKIPVITIDETLTSEEARRRLIQSSKTISRKSGVIDMTAATLILQEYLDTMK